MNAPMKFYDNFDRGQIGLAGRQFAREILTEEDGNLNRD
jgi:hypothetical protein